MSLNDRGRERSGKSKRIILHLRYLVTPHQMQNCVNYCRNKWGSEMERKEKQNTKLCTHIAQMQMHKTQCVIPHFLSSIISIDVASCANIDRFFGATIISTLSVNVWIHLSWWKDKSQNGGEIYNFFNFLEMISNNSKRNWYCKRASHTNKVFFSLSLFDCLGGFHDWS